MKGVHQQSYRYINQVTFNPQIILNAHQHIVGYHQGALISSAVMVILPIGLLPRTHPSWVNIKLPQICAQSKDCASHHAIQSKHTRDIEVSKIS